MGKRPDNSRRPQRSARIIPLPSQRRQPVSDDALSGNVSRSRRLLDDKATTKLAEKKVATLTAASKKGANKAKKDATAAKAVATRQPVPDSATATPKKGRAIEMPGDRKSLREAKKKARQKAKAEKAYAKQYGGDGGPSTKKRKGAAAEAASNGSDGGPRAALYKGKMGSSQKKSQKLQTKAKAKSKKMPAASKGKLTEKAAGGIASAVGKMKNTRIPLPTMSMTPKTSNVLRKLAKPLLTLGLIVLCAASLYGPAQQYYVQMRETDRLQAEYAAVTSRSDSLKAEIDTLKTDEGIEDRAHEDLGYIKSNEKTASIKGIEFERDDNFSSNVPPGSIHAPETWYSPVLDVFFGYTQ